MRRSDVRAHVGGVRGAGAAEGARDAHIDAQKQRNLQQCALPQRAPSHTVGGISTASRGGRHTTVAATVAWVMIRLHPCGVRMRQICCHLRRTPAHPFAFRVSLRSRCIDRYTSELCCDSAYSVCSACLQCWNERWITTADAIGDRRLAYDCVLLQ